MPRTPSNQTTRTTFFVASVLAMTALGHTAVAEAPEITVKWKADAFFKASSVRSATDLVPSPAGAGYRETFGGLSTTMHLQARTERLRFGAQLRFDADSKTDAAVHLDEAYGELKLSDHAFVFAGRRILSWGQSYGLNPADVFQDPLRENAVFRQSQARTKIEGADVAGADFVFDSGHTLTLLYAPGFDRRDNGIKENFAFARFSGFANDGALEYAVSLIGGARPGLGASLNYAIGDATVVYLDGTVRKGREKRTITDIAPSGALTFGDPGRDRLHPYVTLGVGYTHGSGWTANLEYTHDAAGYSGSEWRQISRALDQVSPASSAIHGQSLGQINGLLDHYTLRQNYAFGRLANDSLLGGKLATELTVLHSLDDGSGSLGLRLEYPFSDQIALGLKATHNYGGKNKEFTLRPGTNTIAIYTSFEF